MRVMKKTLLPSVIGLLLICLGSSVIFGWVFHIPMLISIIPGYINMVFNTALCFILSGLAVFLSQKKPEHQTQIYLIFGTLILSIAGLTLLEYSLYQSLDIDQLFVKVWYFDQNPFPGRMAINTSVGFALVGLSFILFPYTNKQIIALLLQIIIFSVMFLGISALLGYLLKLKFLYGWYRYTRMAIHTSVGMSLLSITLWMMWSNSTNFSNLYHNNENKKILLLSTMILISITGVAGLSGYTIAANPVVNHIELIILILTAAIGIGILLLYWLVLPLINQLVYTKKNAFEKKLLESETRFRLAFDYSPIGMTLVSLEGRWLKVNKALCDIVGYSESEMLQMDFQTITYPDDLEADLKYVKQLYDGEITFYQMEKRYIRKDKKITWILLIGSVIRNEKGIPLYYIGQIQDINDKKKTEEELSFKAYYDTLTGLVNRNQLEHSLDLTISSALRHQQKFAVFFIDLDHFKYINDSLGHDAGDELLKIVGDRLRNNIRKTDIAARLGGDEFIFVLNGTDNPEVAAIYAEKILNIMLTPITIKEHELFVTASIGISFYPTDGHDYQSLIKSADLALYKAKENGRNNYQFCTFEMNEELLEKIVFKKALQTAIKNQEFYLTYLPKADIKNRITGFETLLRWKNDKYKDVSPSQIIPIAEEMGTINQIGDWILKAAIEQGLQWKNISNLPIKITINMSTKQYMQLAFVENVLSALKEVQFFPGYLALEINESLIMQDPDYSMKIIKQLKTHGIEIIIDNFGTGYSSLNYLSQFGVDYIKIDRQFIRNILDNFQYRELVTAIIALSKKLNIKIIAEGIESIEQRDLLHQLGCDEFQGYYISKPLLAEDVTEFIEKNNIAQRIASAESKRG